MVTETKCHIKPYGNPFFWKLKKELNGLSWLLYLVVYSIPITGLGFSLYFILFGILFPRRSASQLSLSSSTSDVF